MNAYWLHVNKSIWRLADDQVTLAKLVLAAVEGQEVEMIPLVQETGILTIAFALKKPLDSYGRSVVEIAMDSTCK